MSTAPPWTAFANERLANEGFRRGGGRAAVIDLLDAQECALSAQEIEDQLKSGERTVGRATVYRVIDELVELGLLGRVELGDGIARFERVFPEGAHHHHHFVCSNCEKLVPFEDEELGAGAAPGRAPRRPRDGVSRGHPSRALPRLQLDLYG